MDITGTYIKCQGFHAIISKKACERTKKDPFKCDVCRLCTSDEAKVVVDINQHLEANPTPPPSKPYISAARNHKAYIGRRFYRE